MALIERVREHYLDQFESFVERQEKDCERGGPEVKFEIPDSPNLYRRLVCIDFIKNDAGAVSVLFVPEYVLTFDPFTGMVGALQVEVAALRWDAVLIHHDLAEAPPLDEWFQRWFDPDDERHNPSARFSGIIHLLEVTSGCVSVDLGTSAPESLWQLLELFERAGARRVEINDQQPTEN